MEISNIKMFELFKNKFGDKEAEAFVYIIEEKMDTKINQRKHELATKDDIDRLEKDISALRLTTKDDMIAMRAELMRAIYTTSLGQLFAIIASVISIMILILKK
jgi:glyoxylate utilization-related uncharacterized protein